MKNKKQTILILLISITFLSIFSSCNQKTITKANPSSKTEFHLGTVVTIKIYDEVPENIFKKAFNRISNIEDKMSLNIEESEVIDINKASGKNFVKVSKDTFNVIEKGKYYSDVSKGNFDITIGPLVQLWNIGTKKAKVPSTKEIKDNLPLVNYKDLTLNKEETKVMLNKKGMILDLGGIAKGYAADEVTKILKNNGINHAIINLGGNVFAMGSKPDGSGWKIGVQNPFDEKRGSHIGIVNIKNKSVVSSGIYERNFTENGKLYHHILNPYTGYPVRNNLQSVTIVADESFDADGLSTGIFALGLDKGMKLVESLEGIDAIFVTDTKKIYVSSSIKDNFEITDSSLKLMNN